MNMQEYREFVGQNAHFAKHSGIELLEVSEGYARAKMAIEDYHLNSLKMVHGGAIFTLADFTCAVAANSHDKVAVGLNVDITYVKTPQRGVLYAEAREISLSNRIGTYTVKVTNDAGEVIAILQATAYRKQGKVLSEPPMEIEPGFYFTW